MASSLSGCRKTDAAFYHALADARTIEASAYRMVAEKIERAESPTDDAGPAACEHKGAVDVTTMDFMVENPGRAQKLCGDCDAMFTVAAEAVQ